MAELPYGVTASDCLRRCDSIKVLNTIWQTHPGMLAFLIDGYARLRKVGVGEGSDRDGDETRDGIHPVEHGGAALRAEMEARAGAFIAGARVLAARAGNGHRVGGKPGLRAKTLPVRFWHARQWQTEIRTGSPRTWAVSFPQLQVAIRSGMAPNA